MGNETRHAGWVRVRAAVVQRPLRVLLLGYLAYGLLGWALLSLPPMTRAEVSGLDNAFTAFSAMSTTGLATVSTPQTYTRAGQLVILGLIQLGGLGYMTLGSIVLLGRGESLSDSRRAVVRAAFVLPEGIQVARFLRRVIAYTLGLEVAGVLLLMWAFARAGVNDWAWQGIFHSVSAFCTAGFSTFDSGLEPFAGDGFVNGVISMLSVGGAVGFLVVNDVVDVIRRRRHGLTLTSKIILEVTFGAIAAGFVYLAVFDPAISALPGSERWLVASFQSMTALTTVGFNTYPLGDLPAASTFFMLILMICGASPAGTGGGLKSTSVSTAFAAAASALRNQDEVSFRGYEIPRYRVTTAYASLVFYLMTYCVGTLALLMLENQAFEDIMFESASALGTVGLSRGLTPELLPASRVVVIVLMYVGRLGPLALGLALSSRSSDETVPEMPVESDLAV